MKRYYYALMLILCFALNGESQDAYRYFQTGDYDKEVYKDASKRSSDIHAQKMEFEQYLENEFSRFEEIQPVVIPVVFNIIQSGERTIDEKLIRDQVEVLNKSFAGQFEMPVDDYYRNKSVDTEISFCLYGFEEPYVRQINLKGKSYQDFTSMKEKGTGLAPFSPESYVNIWICDLENADALDINRNAAGFAQMPFKDELTSGIVIDIDFFGKNAGNPLYEEGKTLVHLMGNYLGLKPLFGFGNCEDDGVDDTPIHSGELILCRDQKENHLTQSSCDGMERMMTRNFMSNVPDECAAMFTQGQKRRMLAQFGENGFLKYLAIKGNESECQRNMSEIASEHELAKEHQNSSATEINIYPIPVSDMLVVEIKADVMKGGTFEVVDVAGKRLIQGDASDKMDIDVSDWDAGVYYFLLKKDSKILTEVFNVIR